MTTLENRIKEFKTVSSCKSGNCFLIKSISEKSIKQMKGNPKRVAFCNFLICS